MERDVEQEMKSLRKQIEERARTIGVREEEIERCLVIREMYSGEGFWRRRTGKWYVSVSYSRPSYKSVAFRSKKGVFDVEAIAACMLAQQKETDDHLELIEKNRLLGLLAREAVERLGNCGVRVSDDCKSIRLTLNFGSVDELRVAVDALFEAGVKA